MAQAGSARARATKKQTNLTVILMALFILALVATLVTVLVVNGKQTDDKRYAEDAEAVKGLIEGRSPEEIQALLDQIVEEGMFNVSMNGQIIVGADGKGDVKIENIETNRYYMQVDIIVTDSVGTQTAVYSSGVIKPGYSIDRGTFKVMPPAGTVDALAVFRALDPSTQNEIGRTNLDIILTREA